MMNTLINLSDTGRQQNVASQTAAFIKRSRQKEAILSVLNSTMSHPTAVWIYDEVRREIPNISLGTVYRNLKLLAERGEIVEIEIDRDIRRFSADTTSHHHGKCARCGGIFDIDNSASRKLATQIQQTAGFRISECRVAFHGTCKKCQDGNYVERR